MNLSPLKVVGFAKSYGAFQATKDVSFEIEQGGFMGLLGLNGSGKSTTINAIAGLLTPTRGSISIMGYDIALNRSKALSNLGFMPQSPSFNLFDQVEEGLVDHACLYGYSYNEAKRKINNLLEVTSLQDKRRSYFKELSGGMKQRAMLIKAVCSDPKLLILDEPTAGVDVKLTKKVWNYIEYLNKKGTAVLLTTNVIDDVTRMCKQLVFLRKGVVVKKMNVQETKAILKQDSYYLITKSPVRDEVLDKINEAARSVANFKTLKRCSNGRLSLTVPKNISFGQWVKDIALLENMTIESVKNIDQIDATIRQTLV